MAQLAAGGHDFEAGSPKKCLFMEDSSALCLGKMADREAETMLRSRYHPHGNKCAEDGC